MKKCKNPECKKVAFNGIYCLNCGYPGKVSKRGRKTKKMAKKTVETA